MGKSKIQYVLAHYDTINSCLYKMLLLFIQYKVQEPIKVEGNQMKFLKVDNG